jgi:hypothetical protein
MISCLLVGGLGNQLFQIFTTIAYSIENNMPFVFNNKKNTIGMTYRETYWNTFLKSLQPYLVDDPIFKKYLPLPLKERGFKYHSLPYIPYKKTNIQLIGYFQSYKYFSNYLKDINSLLQIEEQKLEIIQNYSRNYKNTISMHFRIGDYKNLSNIYHILDFDYYKKALQNIIYNNNNNKTELQVLYFCEEKDKQDVDMIINELINEFKEIKFECIDFKISDWQQMLIMGCCNYNIIANSTFSWWAAYFNNNNNKIICYPHDWFKKKDELDDLFPKEWIKVL